MIPKAVRIAVGAALLLQVVSTGTFSREIGSSVVTDARVETHKAHLRARAAAIKEVESSRDDLRQSLDDLLSKLESIPSTIRQLIEDPILNLDDASYQYSQDLAASALENVQNNWKRGIQVLTERADALNVSTTPCSHALQKVERLCSDLASDVTGCTDMDSDAGPTSRWDRIDALLDLLSTSSQFTSNLVEEGRSCLKSDSLLSTFYSSSCFTNLIPSTSKGSYVIPDLARLSIEFISAALESPVRVGGCVTSAINSRSAEADATLKTAEECLKQLL